MLKVRFSTSIVPSIFKLTPTNQAVLSAIMKVLKAHSSGTKLSLIIAIPELYITINVNDYVEHREVLKPRSKKLANRVWRKVVVSKQITRIANARLFHRIISRMDGVTSYSEGRAKSLCCPIQNKKIRLDLIFFRKRRRDR